MAQSLRVQSQLGSSCSSFCTALLQTRTQRFPTTLAQGKAMRRVVNAEAAVVRAFKNQTADAGCTWGAAYCSIRTEQRRNMSILAAPKTDLVLETQPGLSDFVAPNTGVLQTIIWKVVLDMVVPLTCLIALQRAVDWAAERAGTAMRQRLQGDDEETEVSKQSTIVALFLLAMRAPARFVLPPLYVAYTVRTALNIVDLVVHKYEPKLPAALQVLTDSISKQLVPLDNIFAILLSISGALFTTWFLIQLKDLFIREIILYRAIRSGRKELERVYLPLSTLVTWAAVLACGVSILASLGLSLQPLLAVGGAGGIAAGFASQQVLTNIVSGINIFLTRPFVVGDQVQFVGAGADIEGLVEGVEIMRTLVRTSEGTLVSVPNKIVAELAVFNRTRTLTTQAVSAADVAVAAAAAPQRRVLCFHIQLNRDSEPIIDDVIRDVKELLEDVGHQQLKDNGIVSDTDSDDEDRRIDVTKSNNDIAKRNTAERLPGFSRADQSGDVEDKSAAKTATTAASVKQAVDSAIAAVSGSSAPLQGDTVEGENPDDVTQQVLVSITLSKLTVEHIKLFVRCEIVLPAATLPDAFERQSKATLLGVSGMLREKYGGVLLW